MARLDAATAMKARAVILAGAVMMAVLGLLAVLGVLPFGRIAGYALLEIAALDVLIALVVFRDREA